MLTAFLDTCALWPSLQRDFLLSMAYKGLCRPTWSAEILKELSYVETKKLTSYGLADTTVETRVHRLIHRMQANFTAAEVTGWEDCDVIYGLPDPDDEHVVAAAVAGRADVIVTNNLKDFPPRHLPHDLEVLTVRDFATHIVARDPERAMAATGRPAYSIYMYSAVHPGVATRSAARRWVFKFCGRPR